MTMFWNRAERKRLRRIKGSPGQRLVRCARRLYLKEILVLGDSHARVFRNPLFLREFPGHFFHVVPVGGATISGLSNPRSKSQAMPIFDERLRQSRPVWIVVLLGEVDTGFIIWLRATRHGTEVLAMMEAAVTNYRAFLEKTVAKGPTLCISTPLPTITDDNDWGEVATARMEVRASQWERTALTLEFNRRMREHCAALGIPYLDLDGQCLGEDGLVRSEMLCTNRNDHHYDDDVYAAMLATALKPLFSPLR
jgi:hypothetical protein